MSPCPFAKTAQIGSSCTSHPFAHAYLPTHVSRYNPKVPRAIHVDLMHTLDHNSVVCCVKFSLDGKLVATGCNRSTQIYDVASGIKIR